MIRIVKDHKYNYTTMFNTENGHYVRMSDEQQASHAHLIDVGIMHHCVHGRSQLCIKSGIKCYQNGLTTSGPNMTLENFKRIIDEIKDKTFEVALGGRGDPDMHENFEELLAYAAQNNVVPNFTTSGLGMTPEKAKICKKWCGAVAVSMYSRLNLVPELAIRKIPAKNNKKVYRSIDDIPVKFTFGNEIDPSCYWDAPEYKINNLSYSWYELHHMSYSDEPQEYEFYRVYNEVQAPNYTMRAIKMLLDAGVTTNIHYVLSNTTIDEAILRLKHNGFPAGINAVIFLLHKPVGLGDESDVLNYDDPRLVEFFELIDQKHDYKVGFDSCTIPALLNFSKKINMNSVDTCEAARFSMYITADMIALPCSFDNVDQKYAFDLRSGTIQDAWDSEQFNRFRNVFETSCPGCPKRAKCLGGCPLQPSITLCNKKEKYNSLRKE